MKTLLITGGTGFVGSEFLEKMQNKYKIFAIYRKEHQKTSKVNWIKADLVNWIDFSNLLKNLKGKKVDCIIHLGGATPNRAYKEDSFEATTEGTKNIIWLGKEIHAKKMIFLSSISVTFPNPGQYAKSKILAEQLIKSSGINFTIIRPETIIGKGAKDFMRTVDFIRKNNLFPVLGLGKGKSQPISASNMVEIIRFCIESSRTNRKTYLAVGKESVTMKEMLSKIARRCGKKPSFIPVLISLAKILGFFIGKLFPASGINPERTNILSFSRSYDPKIMDHFNVSLDSFDQMVSFLH